MFSDCCREVLALGESEMWKTNSHSYKDSTVSFPEGGEKSRLWLAVLSPWNFFHRISEHGQ
jgi:hypothetical protein